MRRTAVQRRAMIQLVTLRACRRSTKVVAMLLGVSKDEP
jgi:hypothetical protein